MSHVKQTVYADQDADLDISVLLAGNGCALCCSSKDEAESFLHYVKLHYPERCKAWDESETEWDRYESMTCYTFDIHDGSDWKSGILQYTRSLWFCENGYKIIYYSELVKEDEELEESDLPIEFLIGG